MKLFDFRKKEIKVESRPNIYTENFFAYNNRTIMRSGDDLNSLKQLYKDNAIIYSLVDWKASRMGEIKPELYKIINVGVAKEYRKWNGKYTDRYEINQLKKLKALAYEEIELESISMTDLKFGKIKKLLRNPNQFHTWAKFIYHYSASRDVSGFQAIWGNRLQGGLNDGKFEEMYPLPSHLTEIIGGGMYQPISAYKTIVGTQLNEYQAEDVLMLSNHSFEYDAYGTQLMGTSKVRAALQEADTFKYAKERELYSYQTGDAQTILSPKDLQVAEAMSENKTGVQAWIDTVFKMLKQKNRSNISVSPHGLDAIKIGTSLKDSNTSESKADAIANMCGVWHINPIIIGINSTNTDSKIKEVTKMALRDAVFPEFRDFLQGMNDWWISTYNTDGLKLELSADYDVFEEFNQDMEQKANALAKLDMLSDNEKRTDWLGYDKLEDERATLPQKYWDISIDPINLDYGNDSNPPSGE